MAVAPIFFMGELIKAREHGDKVLALYEARSHRHLADLINHDPKTVVGVYASHWTWMLGYPDQAVQVSDAKDAHARRRGHAFDLGWALTVGRGRVRLSLRARGTAQARRGVRADGPREQPALLLRSTGAPLHAGSH